MRSCTKCKASKCESDFPKNGFDPYGKQRYRASCKSCEQSRSGKSSAAYVKAYKERHPERVADSARRSYLKKKGVIVPFTPTPHADNYSRKGPEHYRKYRQENKEHFQIKTAEWEEKNKERIKARRSEWKRNNPERQSHYYHKRRAAKLRNGGDATPDQVRMLLVDQGYQCANVHCKKCLKSNKKHLDHKVPISNGGRHEIMNLQWLCQRCNVSKGAKVESEWLESFAARGA